MPAPVLAAADPLRLDVAPARFGALIAGHTGAPLQVASVYADEAAIEPLARRAGARLRVLVAVQPRAWMRRVTADKLRTRAEQAAEAAASGLLGAPVDIDVAVHEPAELLLGVAHELDLLVTGARGYGPTPATLLGGVTRRLVAEARCPVIVCARAAPVPLEALLA